MKPAAFLATFLLLAVGFAQQPQQSEGVLNPFILLETPQQIAEVIQTASSELLISAPTIQHLEIAEALRTAMVERGVPTFILTTVAGANEPSSFIHSLFLMGAHIRIVSSAEPFIIVDRTYVVAGPLIARPKAPTAVENETFLLSEPSNTLRATRMFVETFEQAPRFEYRPEL